MTTTEIIDFLKNTKHINCNDVYERLFITTLLFNNDETTMQNYFRLKEFIESQIHIYKNYDTNSKVFKRFYTVENLTHQLEMWEKILIWFIAKVTKINTEYLNNTFPIQVKV